MKNIKLITVLSIFLIGLGGSAQAALYEYSLDIQLLAGYSSLANLDKIGGIEFVATGATISTYTFGSAISSLPGWILQAYGGGNYGLFDDYAYDNVAGTYNPIVINGNIITISSDVQLSFSGLNFYDQSGDILTNGQYFSSAGFQQTAVPLPAAVWLLGSGLVGLVVMRRRQKK